MVGAAWKACSMQLVHAFLKSVLTRGWSVYKTPKSIILTNNGKEPTVRVQLWHLSLTVPAAADQKFNVGGLCQERVASNLANAVLLRRQVSRLIALPESLDEAIKW